MAETLSDRIRQRLDDLQLSERAASLQATGSDATIRMIRSGKSANPRADTIAKLARVLQTTEQWLLTGDEPGEASQAAVKGDVRPADVPFPAIGQLPKDVPVLGTVAGSARGNGSFQLTSDVVDYVRRPYGLLGAMDVYALYVEGESMIPKYVPGDLVFVHPHRKPRSGDYVVIQEPDTSNGELRGFIKRLLTITTRQVRTEQFNPKAALDFTIRPGLQVHRVMTENELYGV
jgi:phage repressor protein C with HTH and peptisase S24 domain